MTSGWSGAAAQSWLSRLVVVATGLVLGLGSVGLALACAGRYSAVVAIPGGLLLGVGIAGLGWPGEPGLGEPAAPSDPGEPGPSGPGEPGPGEPAAPSYPGDSADERAGGSSGGRTAATLAMALIALASAVVNGMTAAQHLLINRDPGAYLIAGRWIARTGSLRASVLADWQGTATPVAAASNSVYADGSGHIEMQFSHFVPVLLADAFTAGPHSMFVLPAVLGALGLCAVFLVATQLVSRLVLVLAGMIGLAGSLPQLAVSRDTYSETTTQLFLWVAIWSIIRLGRRPRVREAAFLGLVLGGVMMTRIDGALYLIPLFPLLAGYWLVHRTGPRRSAAAQSIGALVLGLLPGSALANFDTITRSGTYYHDLRAEVAPLRIGLALSVAASVLLVLLGPTIGRLAGVGWFADHARIAAEPRGNARLRFGLAEVAAGASVLILLFLWLVRPLVMKQHGLDNPLVGLLQQVIHEPVDIKRTYGEHSVQWLAWYLGKATVALAILGVALLVWLAIRTRWRPAIVLLLMVGVSSAVYLWAPSISPDQVWSSRRYVPATYPLVMIAAVLCLDRLAGRRSSRPGGPGWTARLRTAAALVGAVLVTTEPLAVSAPVARFRPEASRLSSFDQTCAALGPHAAVVFIAGESLALTAPQTIRAWCGLPAAILDITVTEGQVRDLAGLWHGRGRALWLLTASAEAAAAVSQQRQPLVVARIVNTTELEQRLVGPPRRYQPPIRAAIYATPIT